MKQNMQTSIRDTLERRLKPLVIEQLREELRDEVIDLLKADCDLQSKAARLYAEEVKESLREELNGKVRRELKNELKEEIRIEVTFTQRHIYVKEVRESLNKFLEPVVRKEIEQRLGDQLKNQLWNQICADNKESYSNELQKRLREELKPQIAFSLRGELVESVTENLIDEIRSDMTDIQKAKLWKDAQKIADIEISQEKVERMRKEIYEEMSQSIYEEINTDCVDRFINGGLEADGRDFIEYLERFLKKQLKNFDKTKIEPSSDAQQSDGDYVASRRHLCAKTHQYIEIGEPYEVLKGLRYKTIK